MHGEVTEHYRDSSLLHSRNPRFSYCETMSFFAYILAYCCLLVLFSFDFFNLTLPKTAHGSWL